MRICDVTQAYHGESGGIRTYLSQKQEYLEQTGHEHLLIVPGDRDGLELRSRIRTVTLGSPAIPGCPPYRGLIRWGDIARLLRAYRPEVIEFGDPYLAGWVSVAHARAFPESAAIGFCHTDTPRAYFYPVISRALGRSAARVARKLAIRYVTALYRDCDAVVAASPSVAKSLRRFRVPNTALIPLGVDSALFHPRRRSDAVRRSLGISPEERLLVYAGRLNAEKRTPVLLEALERLPEDLQIRTVLIGDGPHRSLAEAAALRDPRIAVLPYTRDRLELATLLASADLYVTAAPHETFGLAVVEAQASGLAVAGVKAGALIDRVPSEVGALASPDSAADLAAVIAALLRSDFRGKGRHARRLAEELSWRRTFDQLLSVYRQIVEHKRSRLSARNAA